MAESAVEPRKLADIFEEAWSKYQLLEDSEIPTASDKYQCDMKECMKLLIQCTNMVNLLVLFSKNEMLEEISTPNIRYLLLPVFLGDLYQKLTTDDRCKCLKIALIYYKDFLRRCNDYKVITDDLSSYFDEKPDEKPKKTMPVNREDKIRRYKENKEIKDRILVLQKRLKDAPESVDEDIMRNYYTDWLKLNINNTLDNIKMLYDELDLLEQMETMKLNKSNTPIEENKKLPPFKPIVITRENLKDHVFGPGYRSLPTMTEDEYFELEMRQGKIVQEYNTNQAPKQESSDDEEETEEKLEKARAWDEWKDTHRRGDGNKERHG